MEVEKSIRNVMENRIKVIYKAIFVFGSYHLIRDILQIAGIENVFSQVLKKQHEWAKIFGEYHEYLGLPLDLIMIIGSIIILKRQRSGNLGIVVFLSIVLV